MTGCDAVGEDFGDVAGGAVGEVLDLLAAGDAGDADDGVGCGGGDGGEEAARIASEGPTPIRVF